MNNLITYKTKQKPLHIKQWYFNLKTIFQSENIEEKSSILTEYQALLPYEK
jgi:hypothetical protein